MARGRPRKVDPASVLDAIMMTFWKHGYLDTTMTHLTTATKMAKPGLYAAFGDKEALYQTAIEHYKTQVANPMLLDIQHSEDDTKTTFTRYLERVASTVLNPLGPKGCLIANSLIQCPAMSDDLMKMSKQINEDRRQAFLNRLKAAQQQGELSPESNTEAISHFLAAQVISVTTLAKSGTSKDTLDQIIQVAISGAFK